MTNAAAAASPAAGAFESAAAAADDQRHAIAVAVATAAAAEAAVASAHAAMEVARLTRPPTSNSINYARDHHYHYAAIVIQTAFRGYLVSQ